jgi:hypothetical protein
MVQEIVGGWLRYDDGTNQSSIYRELSGAMASFGNWRRHRLGANPVIRRAGQVASLVVAILAAASSRADDEAARVAADAVREQGFPCQEPASAERDAEASKPDEAVWILQCKDGRYEVRFKGDTKAEIERLQ